MYPENKISAGISSGEFYVFIDLASPRKILEFLFLKNTNCPPYFLTGAFWDGLDVDHEFSMERAN